MLRLEFVRGNRAGVPVLISWLTTDAGREYVLLPLFVRSKPGCEGRLLAAPQSLAHNGSQDDDVDALSKPKVGRNPSDFASCEVVDEGDPTCCCPSPDVRLGRRSCGSDFFVVL